MKIGALLSKDSIRLNGKASGKKAVIDAMVLLMEKGNHLRDARRYKEAVFDREAQGSTGIGDGVAIPYGRRVPAASDGGGFSGKVSGNHRQGGNRKIRSGWRRGR